MAVAEEEPQVEGLPSGATVEPLAPRPAPAVQGLPAGATVEPLHAAAAPSPTAAQSQVEGLPEGATVEPFAPPPAPAAPARGPRPAGPAQLRAEGQAEGWMPATHAPARGDNPVFRPGSPPSLYQDYNPPKPQGPQPATIPPQQEADLPPRPAAAAPPKPAETVVPPPASSPAANGPVAVPGIPQRSNPKTNTQQVYRPGDQGTPNWAETPLLPKLYELSDYINQKVYGKFGQQYQAQQQAALTAYDQNHPYQAKVNEGLQEFLNGQSTPANIALLASIPESKLISALFAAQAARGTYKSAEDAYQAHLRGDNPEAAKLATEAGLTALMGLAAAAHATGARTYTGAYGEKGVRVGGETVGGEVGYKPAHRAPGPTGSYSPEEGSTVSPGGVRARANAGPFRIGPRGEPTAGISGIPEGATVEPLALPAPQPGITGNVPQGTPAEPATEAARPVVQASSEPAEIHASAARQEPALKAAVEQVVEGVPGARVEGSRVKEPESQANKEERGKPAETNIDNLGARISVETPEAARQVQEKIEQLLPVTHRDKIDSNGLDVQQYGVQTGKPGEANQVSEIQVVPKAQAEAMKETTPLYEQQKAAVARGDQDEVDRLEKLITRRHVEAAGQQSMFAEPAEGAGNKISQETTAPERTTKYKYGNTQTNIPDGSPAAQALDKFRAAIPEGHLAGDGRDVGDGGNHVTVRYGIKGDDTAGIRKFIESQPPFTAHLGETDVFPPSEHSNGAAVVHARIEAPELTRLNDEIQQHGDFAESSFKDYKPHATIAYVDPKLAEQYKGRPDLKGASFPVNSILIADRNGNQVDVPLKGQGAMPASESSLAESGRPLSTESVTAPEGRQALAEGSQASRVLPGEKETRSIVPSESVNEGGTSKLGSIDPTSQKIIQQPEGDYQRQMAMAREVKPEFVRMLSQLANEHGTTSSGVNLKGEEQVKEKLAVNNRPANTISDYIRARMPFNTVEDLRAAVAEIEKKYGAHGVEDFIDNPKAGGYRAVHLQIHLPNGQSAELQMVPREIYNAVEDAHKDYEIARSPSTGPEESKAAFARAEKTLTDAWDKYKSRQMQPGQPPPAGQTGSMRARDLYFDPKRFQYKLNTDQSGVTNLLKGQKWNPTLAGVISVWRDPANNRVYVVNGHHRAQLAKENRVENLNVLHIPAKTAEEARATGALQNIAEGRGTAVDAAKFFRETGLSLADMKDKGISLGEATAANGLALSRLDQSLFDKVVNGTLRQGRAIAIGNATDKPEEQDAILKLIQRQEMKGKKVSDDTIDELARMVNGAGTHTETQQSLFGDVEMRRNLALEKAEISAYIREQIGQEKRLFSTVADQARAEKLEKGKNVIDAAGNARIAQQAAEASEVYDRLSTRTGTVDDVLNQAAKELAEGKGNGTAIKRRAYEQARAALSEALSGGQAAGTGRPEADVARPAEEAAAAAGPGANVAAGGGAGTAPAGRGIVEGSPVTMKDGRSGVVLFVQPPLNGIPARLRVRLTDGQVVRSVRPQDVDPVAVPVGKPGQPWIGFDLDKTTAQYTDFKGAGVIGAPIAETVDRIKNILKNGEEVDGKLVKDVRIFTARVTDDPEGAAAAIAAWTKQHVGQALPATNIKDPHMVRLYDDRAVGVEGNTGKVIGGDNAVRETERGNTVQAGGENRPGAGRGSEAEGAGEPVPVHERLGLREGERGPVQTDVHEQLGTAARRESELPTTAPEAARSNGVPRTDDALREPGGRQSGETTDALQERLLARGRYDRELGLAESRSNAENARRAQIEPAQVHGVQVQILNPDGYQLLRKLITPDVRWPGVFLDRTAASQWIARLRSGESRLRQLPQMKSAADGLRALTMALDKGRDADGSVVLLRGDHDADPTTALEELAHRWQERAGLRNSDAQEAVAHRPEFEPTMRELKASGYNLSSHDLAAEIIAKALAGDPTVPWTPEVQNGIVDAALRAAVEEKGPGVLDELPPVSPAVQKTVEGVKEYARQLAAGQRTEVRGVGRPDREGPHPQGREPGRGVSERAGQRPGIEGAGDRARQAGAPESQLGKFKRLSQQRRLPGEQPLPGFGEAVREQDEAAAAQRGEDLTQELLQPKGDISRAAGEMERFSPLFAGTDANPQGSLFKREADPFTTWQARHGLATGDAAVHLDDFMGASSGRPWYAARRALIDQGLTPAAAAVEIPARIAAGDYAGLGLTAEQARNILTRYTTRAAVIKGRAILRSMPEQTSSPLFKQEGTPAIPFPNRGEKAERELDERIERAQAAPRAAEPPRPAPPGPRETTATTINRDTGKGLQDTIEELGKLPKGKMTMAEHIENGVDHAFSGAAETGNALTKSWARMKGALAGAYQSWSAPAPWTDYHTSLGDLRSAEFKAAIDLNNYQKALKEVAPNERTRAAMTVYAEARSEQQLKKWAVESAGLPDKKLARAFTDALRLTPDQKAVAAVHQRYYDQQLKILTDAGLLPQGVSHYAMHMYASDPEAMAKIQAATDLSELAPNPSFLKQRTYPSYFEAIKNGEKPVTLDAGKILSAYHDAFTKTFMTRAFIRSLLYGVDPDDGRPLAALESRAGWVHVDNDRAGRAQILRQPKRPDDLTGYVRIPAAQVKNFKWELTPEDKETLAPGFDKMSAEEQSKLFGPDDPRFPVPAGKVMAMKGDILIHPKYAGRVSDLVARSWLDSGGDLQPLKAAVNAVGKAGALAKAGILYGSGFHQMQLGVHAMEHMVNPMKLRPLNELAKDPTVLEGVRHGLNLLNVDAEGVLSGLPGMGTYHRYLFRDYIPRLKAEMYLHAYKRNVDRFGGGKPGKAPELTQDELHHLTAMQANAAFGGLDPAFFRHLSRMNHRTYKAIEHQVLFSPDFTKARAQFVGQAFNKFGSEQRWALLRGALAIYGVARIVNAVINRGDAKWKAADALSIVTPKSWGAFGDKRFGLRTVQGDIMRLVEEPKQWAYNRINPVTLRPTIEFITGRDNFGRQESKEHFAKDYLKQLTPIPVQKLFTTSDEGWVATLLSSAGMETGNYRTPLEKQAHEMRLAGIPDKPDSEDKTDENRHNVQAVLKLRLLRDPDKADDQQPKAYQDEVDALWKQRDQGKMSEREVKAILERAGMTELQYDVSHLGIDDALEIWQKADAAERDELKDVIEKKADRAVQALAKDRGDDAAGELEARLKKQGIDLDAE